MTGADRLLGESFNIRGVGAPENTGDGGRIIVNVDGVAKFYEQYRLGSFFSDPELYKRVEVLRGPASSTLYGSGALGGVINFETKDASDFIAEGQTGALRVKGSYNSNRDGYLGSTVLAQRLGENAEFLLTGNYRQADPYETGNGTTVVGSNFRAWSGLAKGTFKVARKERCGPPTSSGIPTWTTSSCRRPARPPSSARSTATSSTAPPSFLREPLLGERHARSQAGRLLLQHHQHPAGRLAARLLQPRLLRRRLRFGLWL